MVMISALSRTRARASRSRARPSTVRSPSLHPLPSSVEGSVLEGCACTRRSPSPMLLTTDSTAAAPPAVITPMAISAALAFLGSLFGATESWARSTVTSAGQQGEEGEVVGQVSGDQKVPPNMLATGRAHPTDQLRVAEQLAGAEGRPFDGLHRIAGDPGHDLDRYAPRHAADDRLAFPHGRGHVDPEACGQRLVDDDDGRALQRVHLGGGIRGQRDHPHVRIMAGRLLHLGEGIAPGARRRAGEYAPD